VTAAAVRKPKPRAVPTTLAELVLDLEERADAGDGDFEVPAAEWAQLVAMAGAAVDHDEQARRELAAALLDIDRDRALMAKVLGCDARTDLVEVARGYVLALEEERRARRGGAPAAPPSRSATQEKERAVGLMASAVGEALSAGLSAAEITEALNRVDEPAQSRELPHPAAVRREKSQAAARDEVFAASLRKLLALELARALGVGVDTSWTEALEVARGYAMALDAERDHYVRRVAELGNQAALRPADRPDEDEHPAGCKVCKTSPYVLRVNGVELAGHYADRDVAEQDGRRRCIGGFEVYEPRKQRVWDVYSRCETCDELTDGHVTSSCPKAKAEEPEVEHPECPHCGEADGHKPEDCAAREDDRPTMVESLAKAELEQAAARARPKKRRASKKFPKGGDIMEPCTACGLPFGDHDGQRCPKKQRRMKYVDEPTTAEAPF
jgi:hypothetical protein